MIQLPIITFLGLLNLVLSAPLTSDQGYFQKYEYYNSDFQGKCQNNYVNITTIPFNGIFENIPQVIIIPQKYDINNRNNGNTQSQNEFLFSITSTTKTSFTVEIQCPQDSVVNGFWFKWIAIDDSRVFVINSFNTNVNYATDKSYTFPHSNPNFVQGFVTTLSFGFRNPFSYSLSISTITTTDVTIHYISNGQQNQLGFQVVLGTAAAFIQSSSIITTFISDSSYYDSGLISFSDRYLLALPLLGLAVPLNTKLKILFIETDTATTVSYKYGTWGAPTNAGCDILTHSQVQINIVPLSMSLKFMRVLTKTNQAPSSLSMELQITELNQSFSTISLQNYLLVASKQTLNIVAYFQCSEGKKIQLSLLKHFPHNGNDKYYFTQNCNNRISSLTFDIQFYQRDQVDQNIGVEVTNQGFILTSQIVGQSTISTMGVMEILDV